ncbi:MAG: hypothetical protein ACXAB8_19080 [Promethearchaeota archaeon]|jgi:DMSO/TMAO reductase YedYZ molybdopterin-dependent catalytic subunit
MNQNSEKIEKSRLPPGQHLTDRFPVLQKGRIPNIDRENFILELEGELDNPMKFKIKRLLQIFIVLLLGVNMIQSGEGFLSINYLT